MCLGYNTIDTKIELTYLGFEYYVHPGGSLNKLNFELKNNTLDTLYISTENRPRVRKQFKCEEK